MKTLWSLVGVVSLALAGSARDQEAAKDSPPYAHFEGTAWQNMQKQLLHSFSEDAASRVTFMAYHGVAADLCEGVSFDKAKMNKAVADLHPENWTELTEEARANWYNVFLLNYGMAYGVLMAEHADQAGPFCAEAKATAADKESADRTLFTSTAAK